MPPVAIWTTPTDDAERFGLRRGRTTSSVEDFGPRPSTPESPEPKEYTFMGLRGRWLRITLGLGPGALFGRPRGRLLDLAEVGSVALRLPLRVVSLPVVFTFIAILVVDGSPQNR